MSSQHTWLFSCQAFAGSVIKVLPALQWKCFLFNHIDDDLERVPTLREFTKTTCKPYDSHMQMEIFNPFEINDIADNIYDIKE